MIGLNYRAAVIAAAFAAGAAIVWTADALLQRIGRGRAGEKR